MIFVYLNWVSVWGYFCPGKGEFEFLFNSEQTINLSNLFDEEEPEFYSFNNFSFYLVDILFPLITTIAAYHCARPLNFDVKICMCERFYIFNKIR
jgi:hypothetical protein